MYTGPSHFRQLGAADLEKFGVEGFKQTTWARGVEAQVDDVVGAALTEHLSDEFVEVADDLPTTKQEKTARKEAATTPATDAHGGNAPAPLA